MAEKIRKGICPDCGRELQIPVELQEFSCMYCGRRMAAGDLIRTANAETEAALAYAKAHVADCVRGQRDLRKIGGGAHYDDAFQKYEAAHGDVFRKLEEACKHAPDRQTEYIDAVIETFIREVEEGWKSDKDRFAAEDDKMVIAMYMVPMVGHLKLDCSAEFNERLQKTWVERYPKNPFYVGDYETLRAGFNKKFLGLCFITTAVCRQEGKPDDCAELTAFRRFRDGYLRGCADGTALIEEYYEIAPVIVTMISVCEDQNTAYGEIRSRWLQGCYEDLQAGRMEACKARYTDMVRTLEQKYLH